MISGKEDDPPEKKPFLFSFSKAKVLAAWLKIGAMPLTRACLELELELIQPHMAQKPVLG